MSSSTLSRVTMLYAVGASTLTADRMLPHFAQVLWRPTEYAMLQDGVLQRPTKYHQLVQKYSDSRHSTSTICANIVTADKVCDATGWNTLTADRVPDAIRWNTLTGDRVCATTAKILSRPTEYLMRFCVYCSAVFLNSILFRKIKK